MRPAGGAARTLSLEKFASSRNVEPSPSCHCTRRAPGANTSKCAERPFIPGRRGIRTSLRSFKQLAVIVQPSTMHLLLERIPVDFRDEKSLRRIGVRYRGLHCRVPKARKPGEFSPPALRHGFAQFLPEVTEELKRRLRGELLTHEQHGNAWRQEIDGNRGAYRRPRWPICVMRSPKARLPAWS